MNSPNLSPQIRTERPPAEARGCRMARTVRCHRVGPKKKRPVTPMSTFAIKRIVEVEVAGDIDDTGTGTQAEPNISLSRLHLYLRRGWQLTEAWLWPKLTRDAVRWGRRWRGQ
ncbi:hypothetical protein BGW80DRAFT_1248641 [Lactifluus volemus]|nr:hypothetical protein BGW80DRAFT_1450581 [Lactifluus volemus]KAH9979252.1 hypothetical protein BGW80DRAFT_1248641 [Lactifluus volemus]